MLAGSALLAQLFPASLRASFPWNAAQQGAGGHGFFPGDVFVQILYTAL